MKKQIILLILFIPFILTIIASCNERITNGKANINGTTLYYEVTGTGTPIVFLHGFTGDHRNWDPQVKFFSKKFKVITYDARGHGQSAMPDSISYSYSEDLVGLSMGGAPAFYYAYSHPEKVSALVLAEGGPSISDTTIMSSKILNNYFRNFSNVYNVYRKEGIEKARAVWLTIDPIKNAAENPLSRDLIKAMIYDYSGWHWHNRDPQKSNPDGTPDLMGKLKTPTLIITGDLSHAAIKQLVAAQNKYIPNSKKVVLRNSNHMLNLENPDQFNNELLTFLKENSIK
jgi:3-oxoadipate enol-lactonase